MRGSYRWRCSCILVVLVNRSMGVELCVYNLCERGIMCLWPLQVQACMQQTFVYVAINFVMLYVW